MPVDQADLRLALEALLRRGGVRFVENASHWGFEGKMRDQLEPLSLAVQALEPGPVAEGHWRDALVAALQRGLGPISKVPVKGLQKKPGAGGDPTLGDVGPRLLGYASTDDDDLNSVTSYRRSATVSLVLQDICGWEPGAKLGSLQRKAREDAPGLLNDTLKDELSRSLWNMLRTLDVPSIGSTDPEHVVVTDRPEVDRADLRAQVLGALSARTKRVLLYGESGNGKSFLARQIARDHFRADRVVIIREGSTEGSLFDLDLLDLLERAGREGVQAWTLGAKIRAVQEVLRTPGAFELVLLDDTNDAFVQGVLDTTQVPVLRTARRSSLVRLETAVLVEAFSDSEALHAAHVHLPDADEPDLQALCRAVGNRPVVIEIASRLLVAGGQIALADLVSALRIETAGALSDAADLLGGYTDTVGQAVDGHIAEVYRRLVEALSTSTSAMFVLNAVLWLAGSTTRNRLIALAVRDEKTLSVLGATAGIEQLLRLGVLTARGNGVEVNTLTLRVLRNLLSTQSVRIVRDYLELCFETPVVNARADAANDSDGGAPETLFYDISERLPNWQRIYQLSLAMIQMADFAMVQYSPSGSYRCYRISDEIHALVQRSPRLWFSEDPTEVYAVITDLGEDEELLWRIDQRPSRMDKAMSGMAFIADLIGQAANRDSPYIGPEISIQDQAVILSPWLGPDDGIRHRQMSVLPRNVAYHNGFPTWTYCGQQFLAKPFERDQQIEECERCASVDLQHEQTYMAVAFVVIGAWKLAERGGADWEQRMRLADAAFALRMHRGGSLWAGEEIPGEFLDAPDRNRNVGWILHLWAQIRVAQAALQTGSFDEVKTIATDVLQTFVMTLGRTLPPVESWQILTALANCVEEAGDTRLETDLLMAALHRLPEMSDYDDHRGYLGYRLRQLTDFGSDQPE